MKTALRVAALLAALLNAAPVAAQNPFAEPKPAPLPIPRYQKITKFAVRYHDLILNQVEGTAWCNWKQQHCSVGLRHPTTKAVSWLDSESIELKNKFDPLTSPVRIRLFGDSPWREKVATPALPETVIHGGDGDTAQIVLGDGGPGLVAEAYTNKHARADYTITLDLVPDKDGALVGRWSYLSDPVTERNHSKGTHGDRVGIFEPLGEINLNRFLRDRLNAPVSADYGGFLGLQQGGEYWEPLPPHIYGVFVLEDQAAFSGGKPYYPHPHGAYRSSRTIIVIGRDLPIDRSASLAEIETKDEGFEYNVSAVAGTPRVTDEQKQDFERAWTALTRDMSSDEAADFRKLDAVRIYVEFRNSEPGKKTFSWGGADVPWQLQYGDNTADVRIARRVTEAETEPVDQLALPEEVFVEVETGTKIESDTIPIQFGGQGVAGAPTDAVAVRVKDNLYRSAPFVASAPEDLARVALSGKLLVPIVKGGRLAVTVNRDKTQFLRASSAIALASEPTGLWINALKRAAACNNKDFSSSDWQSFAKQSAEHFSRYNTSTDILYGDHAAMLIRRDTFLEVMRHQVAELAAAAKDDGLVDAWYRSVHAAVTRISGYPLADVEVTGPSGKVKFSEAYSEAFKESSFQPSKTADGMERYLKWRRAATREAMTFFGQKMDEALKTAEKVGDCEREDLLKLTSSGFKSIVARIVPLLMRRRDGAALTEPDSAARLFVRNVEDVADGLKKIKDYGTQVNTAIVTAALVLIPPAADLVWTGAGLAGGQGIGVLTGMIGGFAVLGYESAYQIYQTYQEHADVRFAFGSTAALGLERYFDAESKKTEWWQTGALIFGQAVLQGILVKVAVKPVSEGIAAWRGSRIVANLPDGAARGIYRAGRLVGKVPEVDWAALQKLTIDDQFAVATFLLKEEEALMRGGIAGEARTYANAIFRALGLQASGKTAAVELPAVMRELQAQSQVLVDDLKAATPPPDALREVKDKIVASSMAAVAREISPETEAFTPFAAFEGSSAIVETGDVLPVGAAWHVNTQGKIVANESATALARLAAKVQVEWPTLARLPKPGVPWETTINGKPVTFEIEKFLKQGSFSYVYKLKSVPPELAAALQQDGLAGKPLVLKIVKTSEEIGEGFSKGIKSDVLKRMIKGRDLLRNGKIPQVEFTPFEDANILLQEYVPFEEGKFPKVLATDYADSLARFRGRVGVERQRAIAELFSQLGDAKIAALDMHGGNIYLEKSGSGFVAKILDQDFICEFDKVEGGIYGEFLDALRVRPGRSLSMWHAMAKNPADPLYSNARSLMQKVMEHQGWLEFDHEAGHYVAWELDPLEVKKIMPDLLYVPIPDPPPPPPGFGVPKPPVIKSPLRRRVPARRPHRRSARLPARRLAGNGGFDPRTHKGPPLPAAAGL